MITELPSLQLPTTPLRLNFDVDLPESPASSSSMSISIPDHSKSPDSSSVSLTDESIETKSSSSAASQVHIHAGAANSTAPSVSQPTSGLKLVIDNIDKTVKPRHQRIDAQTQSLHYIQVYAVKDRIDYTSLSHSPPPAGKPVYDLIPSTDVYQKLKSNFKEIVVRILVKHISYFSEDFKGLTKLHIPHKYSSEMAKKSEIVSCTVYNNKLMYNMTAELGGGGGGAGVLCPLPSKMLPHQCTT